MSAVRGSRIVVAGACLALVLPLAGCGGGDSSPPPATGTSAAAADDATVQQHLDAALAQLPDLARDVLERTGVPGMAVAVVHDGRTVFAEGFGVREVGKDEAIDPDTVFQVASVSKSVGATVVATQVSDGVLSWDDPVVEHVPDMALSDPFVTQNATVGDFYAHRTGLPMAAGDLLEDIGYDRQYILDHLDRYELDPFRTSYHYANFGTTTGGEAAAAAAGTDWESLSQQALYEPLGMDSTSSRHEDYLARDNRAVLHAKVDGRFQPLFDRDPDPQTPAGGVSSTVRDLAAWMTMLLGDGTFEGEELASPEALLPALTPQAVSSRAATPAARTGSYGYGFNVGVHPTGRVVLGHSGAFVQGAGTAFTVVPELGVGIVSLTNGAPVGAPEALNAQFLELVETGESTADWVQRFGDAFAPFTAPAGDLAGQEPPSGAAAAADLADYAGQYQNDLYGTLNVTVEGEVLRGALGPDGGYQFDLEPWDGDTFAFTPTGENAPDGSRSSAVFDPAEGTVVLDFFNREGLGTWTR